MALPVTITGIATDIACLGPFKSTSALLVGVKGTTAQVGAFGDTYNQERQGQTLTTISADPIKGVQFSLTVFGSPTGTLTASLYATSGGLPTGSALAVSAAYTPAALGLTTSPQWINFPFTAPYTPAASTMYAVVLEASQDANASNYFRMYTQSVSSTYADGTGIIWNGSSWSATAPDFNAIIYGGETYYFFGKDSGNNNIMQVYKATDPTSSWASVTSTTGSAAHQAIAATQVEDVIHIAVVDGATTSCNLKYRTFDMSGEVFVINETIATAFNPMTSSDAAVYGCSICMQNSQPTILYNGPRVANMGSSYSRVYEIHRTGTNVWSTAQLVDAGGTVNFLDPEIVAGVSSSAHLLHRSTGVATFVQRTLNSSYALQTASTSASVFLTADGNPGSAVSYDSGGTTKVVYARGINTSNLLSDAYFDSGNTPTLNIQTDTASGAALYPRLFVDDTDVWMLYLGSNSDLYLQKSTNHGAAFSGEVNAFTGTVTNAFATLSHDGNIYLRGSSYVIPYVVNDNGTLKYNEYVVRTIAPPDNVGTASGIGAASAVSESTAASVADADGVGAATATGTAIKLATASTAAGVGAATGEGSKISAANSSVAAGTGDATAVGRRIFSATNSVAAGVGAATATSITIAHRSVTAAGTGEATTAQGRATGAGVGNAQGIGVATGGGDVAAAENFGTAAGTSNAAATGTAVRFANASTAAGTGAAAATGAWIKAANASVATGTGAATATGTAITRASASVAAGTSNATATGLSFVGRTGTAQGTSDAAATGLAIFAGQGIADGVGTASTAGTNLKSGDGTAAGVGSASAFSFYFESSASVIKPDADDTDGGWLNELGSATNLYASLDETSPSDSDYIISSDRPVSDVCKVRLGNPSGSILQPLGVLYRFKKQGSDPINLRVRLLEGSTEIASWTHSNISDEFLTVDQTLTAPQFAAITDPTNLYFEFRASV